jgi:hypothetical protein
VVRHDSPHECALPSPGEGNKPLRSGRANVVAVFDDDVSQVRCQAALSEINCQGTLLGGRFMPPIRITPRHPTHRKRLRTMTLFVPSGSNILGVEKIQVCPDDADIKGENRDRMPNTLS